MEFGGIGIVPYEPPPAHLKPFFRRKYATFFSVLCNSGQTSLSRAEVASFVDNVANAIEDPEERAKCATRHVSFYNRFLLYGRDNMTIKEHVEERIREAFDDEKARKEAMEGHRAFVPDLFDNVDTNKDGFIDFDEFSAIYKIFDAKADTIKLIFDTMDVNKDGLISLDEYSYACLLFHFSSGPESPISLMAGKVQEEDI